MNTETIGRMMEAKKYQMMAIKALFPEDKQEHIDNIERELKAMFREGMMDTVMNFMNAAGDMRASAQTAPEADREKEAESQAAGKAKKQSGGKKKVSKVTIE